VFATWDANIREIIQSRCLTCGSCKYTCMVITDYNVHFYSSHYICYSKAGISYTCYGYFGDASCRIICRGTCIYCGCCLSYEVYLKFYVLSLIDLVTKISDINVFHILLKNPYFIKLDSILCYVKSVTINVTLA